MREYAKELAKLWPERFTFVESEGEWGLYVPGSCVLGDHKGPFDQWGFWGQVAQSNGVTGDNITGQEKQPDGRYLSLLEALASAVVSKVRERQQ